VPLIIRIDGGLVEGHHGADETLLPAPEDVSPEKGEDRSSRNGTYEAGSDPRLASPFSEEPVDQPGACNEEKDRNEEIEPISHKGLVDIGSDGAVENVPVQEEEHRK